MIEKSLFHTWNGFFGVKDSVKKDFKKQPVGKLANKSNNMFFLHRIAGGCPIN